MKKIFSICLVIIAVVALSVSCKDPEPPANVVGDVLTVDGQKGVVFSVDADGEHGLMVCLDESVCCWSKNHVTTGATNREDGQKNFDLISSLSNWRLDYPVFNVAYTQGEGWYIPAKDELQKLLESALTINPLIEQQGGTPISTIKTYWSSTEDSHESAYSAQVDENGTVTWPTNLKNNTVNLTARPVKKFYNPRVVE